MPLSAPCAPVRRPATAAGYAAGDRPIALPSGARVGMLNQRGSTARAAAREAARRFLRHRTNSQWDKPASQLPIAEARQLVRRLSSEIVRLGSLVRAAAPTSILPTRGFAGLVETAALNSKRRQRAWWTRARARKEQRHGYDGVGSFAAG